MGLFHWRQYRILLGKLDIDVGRVCRSRDAWLVWHIDFPLVKLFREKEQINKVRNITKGKKREREEC